MRGPLAQSLRIDWSHIQGIRLLPHGPRLGEFRGREERKFEREIRLGWLKRFQCFQGRKRFKEFGQIERHKKLRFEWSTARLIVWESTTFASADRTRCIGALHCLCVLKNRDRTRPSGDSGILARPGHVALPSNCCPHRGHGFWHPARFTTPAP